MANFDCLLNLRERMAWIKDLKVGTKPVTLTVTVSKSKSDIRTGNTRITGYTATAPVFWRYEVSNHWNNAAWIASTPDFQTITQMLQSAIAIKCGLPKDRALKIAGGFFAKDAKQLEKLIVWGTAIDPTSRHIEVWQELKLKLSKPDKPDKNENFFDKYWRQYYQYQSEEGLQKKRA